MYCFGFQFSFYILWSNYIYWNGAVRLRINNVHNKEPIAKTVETEADHVSRNQLSDESDSDDDIVTHVVPTVRLRINNVWFSIPMVYHGK
jgi:hypothetical protein